MRVFRNTTCTPTAPPPQQNSHICAHAPGQAVKLTNSTGCSNLTGTGFPYPQSTPTRRLPLPTHLSPPLPAQNSHICTHARTRSSGQTNKQQRLLYTPGRPRLGSQVQAAPNLLAGQGRVHRRGCAPVATTSTRQRRTIASAHRTSRAPVRHSDPQTAQTTGCPYTRGRPRPGHRQWCTGSGAHLSPPLPPTAATELSHLHTTHTGQAVRPNKQHMLQTQKHRLPLRSWPAKAGSQAVVHRRGCAPVATTSTRQRRTIASAHRAHRSGGQTQKHRLPLRFWPAKAGSQAQATSTRVGHPHPHTRTGCPNAPCPSTCTGTGFCCLSAPMFLPAHIICNHRTCRTLDVTTFVRNPFL